MYKTEILIKENREVIIDCRKGGVWGENIATELSFTVPNDYKDYFKYLDIVKSDGSITQTLLDNQNRNKFTYALPQALTNGCDLSMQVVMKKDNGVFKSNIFVMRFDGSICATQILEDNFKDTIEMLAETKADKEELTRISDEKVSRGEYYDGYQQIISDTDRKLTYKVDKVEGKGLSEMNFTSELYNTLIGKRVKFLGEKNDEELKNVTDSGIYTIINNSIPQLLFTQYRSESEDNKNKVTVLQIKLDLLRGELKKREGTGLYGSGEIPGAPSEWEDFSVFKLLSDNNYTSSEKNKLQGIEEGAEANVLEGVQINGTDLSVSNKKVNIPKATNEGAGVVKGSYDKGITVSSDGTLKICEALDGNIDLREHYYPITPYNLDYAVRSVRPVKSHDDSGALLVNTIYDIGTQASLTLTLPTNPEYGDFVQVDLLTGENPLNLTVESALGLTDIDFTPDTNKIYSLFFDYGRIGSDLWGWRFSYAEYQDSEV